jgi:hypothetical protein
VIILPISMQQNISITTEHPSIKSFEPGEGKMQIHTLINNIIAE